MKLIFCVDYHTGVRMNELSRLVVVDVGDPVERDSETIEDKITACRRSLRSRSGDVYNVTFLGEVHGGVEVIPRGDL